MSTFPPPEGIREGDPDAAAAASWLPPGSRLWRHVLLFLLTAITTAGAGAVSWGSSASGVSSAPDVLGSALTYAFWTLLILGSHEMGHYLACRYYRIPATLPFFIPGPPILIGTFGALIRIRGIIPHRRALFDVAAAGPIAGFIVAFPVLIAGLLRAEPVEMPVEESGLFLGPPVISAVLVRLLLPDAIGMLEVGPVYGAGWVGMLVTSLNLFPVGQLDGGHVAYAFSRRLHRILALLTLGLLLGLMIFQMVFVSSPPAYLLWFMILLWMRDRHPRLADETLSIGPGRRLVALLLLLVFIGSFVPVPIIVG